jgi:glycosyltransferase A (GT-A) superfamily protein (DUF2064 family)
VRLHAFLFLSDGALFSQRPSAIEPSGSHTAILFFSHRPEREWQNKWFVRQDYTKNRQVAEAFYQHTRQAVAESGLPVLEINGAQQRGDDFGTRLANAFADAFAQGYERVIAVGSDCPRLHEVNWEAVTERLDEGTPVLGPTPGREGTYLIGLRRSQFDRAAFAALPWTSPALFSALVRHLSARTGDAPALLAPRDDVNGHEDLIALTRSRAVPAATLVAVLRSILGAPERTVRPEKRTSESHFCGRRSRAPPSPPAGTRASA